jgi:hypothetical protein
VGLKEFVEYVEDKSERVLSDKEVLYMQERFATKGNPNYLTVEKVSSHNSSITPL